MAKMMRAMRTRETVTTTKMVKIERVRTVVRTVRVTLNLIINCMNRATLPSRMAKGKSIMIQSLRLLEPKNTILMLRQMEERAKSIGTSFTTLIVTFILFYESQGYVFGAALEGFTGGPNIS